MKGAESGNAMDKLNLEKSQTKGHQGPDTYQDIGLEGEPVEEDLLWTSGRGSANTSRDSKGASLTPLPLKGREGLWRQVGFGRTRKMSGMETLQMAKG